jgi:hypothetical protein
MTTFIFPRSLTLIAHTSSSRLIGSCQHASITSYRMHVPGHFWRGCDLAWKINNAACLTLRCHPCSAAIPILYISVRPRQSCTHPSYTKVPETTTTGKTLCLAYRGKILVALKDHPVPSKRIAASSCLKITHMIASRRIHPYMQEYCFKRVHLRNVVQTLLRVHPLARESGPAVPNDCNVSLGSTAVPD